MGALDVWMQWTGHHATVPADPSQICGGVPCYAPSGLLAPARQAAVINFLLLALPCAMGVVFGATRVQDAPYPSPPPRSVTYEYRYIPGARIAPGSATPDQVSAVCRVYTMHPQDAVTCMTERGVGGGFIFQSTRNYWRLQWVESALYLALAAVLFVVGLAAVRRSQD